MTCYARLVAGCTGYVQVHQGPRAPLRPRPRPALQARNCAFFTPLVRYPETKSPPPPLQKTATGIFLPTSATSNPLPEATVIAVGPGAPNKDGQVVPTAVKAGDRVLLPGWGGNAIKVGEEVRSLLPSFRECVGR